MVIVDTNIWIALLNREDSCHGKAVKLASKFNKGNIIISDFIYSEVLNVLRAKFTNKHCRLFLELADYVKTEIHLKSKAMVNMSTTYFFKYNKLSYTDCLLLAFAKIKKMELNTFDKELLKAWNKEKK